MPAKKLQVYVIMMICLVVLISSPARAEFNLVFGLGYSWGSTTMESGNIPWGHGLARYLDENDNPTLIYPRTRIEFPLDVPMASVGLEYKADKWEVKASVQTNLNDPITKGKEEEFAIIYMDDSGQWWYQTVNGSVTPDVEGRLDSELDAWNFNAKARYKVYSSLSYNQAEWPNTVKDNQFTDLYIGMGYLQQHYKYQCDTTSITKADFVGEWSYLPNGPMSIRYDVTYYRPYIELAAAGGYDQLTGEIYIDYSPITKAKDSQSNHLGRIAGPYSADGDCDGSSWLAGLQVGYEFQKGWTGTMGFEYHKINTDGTQDVDCAAGIMAAGTSSELSWGADSWQNDEKISSEQYSLMLNLKYRF